MTAAGGARRATAVEARSLLWTAFARRCVHAGIGGSNPAASTLDPAVALGFGGWDADAVSAAAVALAAQPPYVACPDTLDVQARPHLQGLRGYRKPAHPTYIWAVYRCASTANAYAAAPASLPFADLISLHVLG